MSAWYYDAGGLKVRVVVNYTAGLGKVDRFDGYSDGTTVRPGVTEGLQRRRARRSSSIAPCGRRASTSRTSRPASAGVRSAYYLLAALFIASVALLIPAVVSS
jgi:hypothetical protein